MVNVTYRGPGDSLSFDGFELKRDAPVSLGEAEIARLLHAGAELEIDRETATPAPEPSRLAPESVPVPTAAADTVPAIDDDNTPHSAAEEEVN